MNSRKVLLGCAIASVLGLGIVAIGLFASGLIPKVGRKLPSGVSSVLVNINLPLNGAELPLNEPVSVYAEAVSDQPVHSLELWLDGAFSPTKMDTSPVDQSTISAVWLWTPVDEGVHRLIVRAIGPAGETVNSNVVRVSVLPREKIADLQVTPIPPGQLPPLETPAANAAFQIPEGPTVAPPPPPFPPQDPPQVPASPAGAPSLLGSINQCDATLLIQDNAEDEEGFYLYRFDPTSTGFTRVATLDKHPGQGAFSYLDPGLGLGNHTYYIANFNGGVESSSNLINLKVTEAQCAAASPQAFGLQDAMLTTSKAVDKVYCYLSVNQGPWTRIPPGSNKFIYPSAGGFDLSKYLNSLISPPPPGGVTLELECWGWSGGTLVYLGYLKKDISTGPVQLIAEALALAALGADYTLPEPPPPPPPAPDIAPPVSLNITRDYDKCVSLISEIYVQSTAASTCKTDLDYGYTYLSWHWTPNCSIPSPSCPYTVKDIDGYRAYRVYPGGKPEQVFLTAGGDKHAWAFLAPTTAGLIVQPEYFVRAYKGNQESIDSQHVTGLTPKYTRTLTPTIMNQAVTYRADFIGSCPAYGPNYEITSKTIGVVVAGFDYRAFWTGSDDCPVMRTSDYYDTNIVFDHKKIQGAVVGATLHWKLLSTISEGVQGEHGIGLNCWIPLVDQNNAIIANYPLSKDGGYDVTAQVRAWVNGLPNKGFTLLSGDRTLNMEPVVPSTDICMQRLSDFELEVSTDK